MPDNDIKNPTDPNNTPLNPDVERRKREIQEWDKLLFPMPPSRGVAELSFPLNFANQDVRAAFFRLF